MFQTIVIPFASFMLAGIPITATPSVAPVTEKPTEYHQPVELPNIEQVTNLEALQAPPIAPADTKPTPPPKPAQTAPATPKRAIKRTVYPGNDYARGFCTWYAKSQLSWIPNGWGNANEWATNARRSGFTVSSKPIVGAVAQTSAYSLGHVAVVRAVNGSTVTVQEANFNGWNVISTRVVSVNEFVYIY